MIVDPFPGSYWSGGVFDLPISACVAGGLVRSVYACAQHRAVHDRLAFPVRGKIVEIGRKITALPVKPDMGLRRCTARAGPLMTKRRKMGPEPKMRWISLTVVTAGVARSRAVAGHGDSSRCLAAVCDLPAGVMKPMTARPAGRASRSVASST